MMDGDGQTPTRTQRNILEMDVGRLTRLYGRRLKGSSAADIDQLMMLRRKLSETAEVIKRGKIAIADSLVFLGWTIEYHDHTHQPLDDRSTT